MDKTDKKVNVTNFKQGTQKLKLARQFWHFQDIAFFVRTYFSYHLK